MISPLTTMFSEAKASRSYEAFAKIFFALFFITCLTYVATTPGSRLPPPRCRIGKYQAASSVANEIPATCASLRTNPGPSVTRLGSFVSVSQPISLAPDKSGNWPGVTHVVLGGNRIQLRFCELSTLCLRSFMQKFLNEA